jgi:hypothetical protein
MRLFAAILEEVIGWTNKPKKKKRTSGAKKKMMKVKECGCLPDCGCKK